MKQRTVDPEKLKRARGVLTQAEAARKLNISYQLLYAYETGRATPPLPRLLHICEVYGIRLDHLLATSASGAQTCAQ